MATNVFANGRKIACKQADGKSVAAFPDVCFTPPQTPAAPDGIPVPYANTGSAKNTRKGSKTVKIGGKEVALRDKSYFKTSTGNEAGSAEKKGIASGVNRGKVQFASWAMNVKIEGKNVVRHLDLTTHNHGSVPGNTGVWNYIDEGLFGGHGCQREFNRVERACGGQEKRGKRGRWVDVGHEVRWKQKHCKALLIKPLDMSKITNLSDQLEEVRERVENIDLMETLIERARQSIIDQGNNALAKIAGKAAAKKIIGAAAAFGGPAGWILTGIALADAALDAKAILELQEHLRDAIEEADWIKDELRSVKGKLQRIPEAIKEGRPGEAQKALAEIQRLAATVDDCTRARKCMLVPFGQTGKPRGEQPEEEKLKKRMRSTKGCCPGQTGHHLIPDAYMQRNSICSGYTKDGAPTVCAEGVGKRDGSHGVFHTHLERVIRKGKVVVNMRKSEQGKRIGDISYEDAREAAIDAHRKTVPLSFCSDDCLRTQLDHYYEKACENQAGLLGPPNPTLRYTEIVKLPPEPEAPAGNEF